MRYMANSGLLIFRSLLHAMRSLIRIWITIIFMFILDSQKYSSYEQIKNSSVDEYQARIQTIIMIR